LILYPFLLVAARVLYLAANNPGQFSMGDLSLVLGFTLAVTAGVYLLASLPFRGRRGGYLSSLVTFVVVVWVFGVPALSPEPWRAPAPGAAAAGIVASALLILALARRPAALAIGAKYLTHTYAILVLWSGTDIVLDWRRERKELAASALVEELSRPIEASGSRDVLAPSIYVIVLDEYANGATLREVLGYDNRAFEDSLRALGFVIPPVVRSNYAQTSLSLASFLNAAPVYPVGREVPPGSRDPSVVDHLVARSRVARFLQVRGYRFVFYPSSWWTSTRSSPLADSIVQVHPRFSLGRALSRTEFRRVLWQNTMLAWFYREAGGDAEIVRGTLEGVGRLASVPAPVFGFAHVLSPHLPYVLGSTCDARPAVWYRDVRGYLSQIQCVNRLVLTAVTRLIRESQLPPIIIIQGDHGTAFLGYSDAPNAREVSPAAARERFGAFGAYYLPEHGAGAFEDTVSAINVLGVVLRLYFGADLAPQLDEYYLSLEQSPFDLLRVDTDNLVGRGCGDSYGASDDHSADACIDAPRVP